MPERLCYSAGVELASGTWFSILTFQPLNYSTTQLLPIHACEKLIIVFRAAHTLQHFRHRFLGIHVRKEIS